jgi:ATP-binding cassette subfamily C (CFTR/MRP) protein 4
LKYIAQSQILRSINLGLYFFTPSVANFATFVVYWATGGYLSLPLVFSTISLLQQIRTTMGRQWTRSIETGSEAFSAANRIEEFFDNFNEEVTTSTTATTGVGFTSVASDDPDGGDIELTDLTVAPSADDESGVPLSRRTTAHSMHDHVKPIIALEACTFTYAPPVAAQETGNAFALNGINFDLFEGELLMVVGSVGSGKSTLLQCILGELPASKGCIKYGSDGGQRLRFGYCQQRPWVLSGSVRCNICVGEKVVENGDSVCNYDFKNPVITNDDLYAAAIESSSLLTDLEQWPDYDLTEIGERGVSISGGQKARISLARAVYSDASIYLLDDPLSACDAKVGKDLFFNCIVASLKSRSKAVVLATHQLQYLPYADRILVLDQGKQVFYGKYAELVSNQAKFPSLELSSKEAIAVAAGKDDGKEAAQVVAHKYDKNWMKRKNSKGEQVDEKGNAVKKIIVDEDRVEGKLSMRLIWRYIISGGTFMGLSALFLAVLSQIISMITDYWLKWWAVDAFFDSQRNVKYVWIFAILTFVCIVIGWLRAQVFMNFNRKSASNLHEKCLWAVIHSPLTFFNSNPTGRILNRFAKDQNLVDETLPLTLFDFLENCFLFCVASLILVCVAIPYMVIIMPPMLYVFYLSREKYIQSSREIKRLEAVTRSPIYSDFSATLDGLVTLRAYNIESRFATSFQQSLNKNSRVYWSFLMVSRWLGFRMDLKSATIVIVLVFVAVILRGTIDVGLIGYAIVYTLGLSGLMQWSVRQSGETETQFTSVERIDTYASLAPEAGYASTLQDYRAKTRKRTISFSSAAPQQQVVATKNSPSNPSGSLEIVNLKVKYRDFLDHVIDGLSLTIPNGCKIGVCGRTGSGKSTILLSLLRLNIITEGDIRYNNESLLAMDLETVRNLVSVIPQDPHLFSGTIRFNLDPFSVYQDSEIWAALRDAHIADVIEQDGNGLHAIVEENGRNFSVGQRQLLSLARAILRKCDIVLMDEVTASIDYVTDKLIQKTIRESSTLKNATIITVAHRLRSIADSNLVAVLGHGKLLEVGKPLDLLNQPSSHFHQLVQDSNEFADILAIASSTNN